MSSSTGYSKHLQSFIQSRASKILKRSKAIVRKAMLKNKD